jgi:hypothetical protein
MGCVFGKSSRSSSNGSEYIAPIRVKAIIKPEYVPVIKPDENGRNFVARRMQEANQKVAAYPIHDEETSQTSNSDQKHAVCLTQDNPRVEGSLTRKNDINVESIRRQSPASVMMKPASCKTSPLPIDSVHDNVASTRSNPISEISPKKNATFTVADHASPVTINRDTNHKKKTKYRVRQSIPLQGDPPGEENHTESIIIPRMKNKEFRF